jgi:hypothetical protein
METTQGISMYSYLYLKPAKMLCIYYHLCFIFNKIQKQEDKTNSAWRWGRRGWGGSPNNVYAYEKCKNDKVKVRKKGRGREERETAKEFQKTKSNVLCGP